jgi:excinuclease UvrABC nuclease subunit
VSRLLVPAPDLERLRRRVRALTENRPGVYRMLSPTGRVLYVGKARRLRTRLLSYFRAEHPDKQARILAAAHDIRWDYVPSEFAAFLGELRAIREHRPPYNVAMNRTRRSVLVKLGGGPAPRFYAGPSVHAGDRTAYGPFNSLGRTLDALRTLNDLLALRDCNDKVPMLFAAQGDLFDLRGAAQCIRHELGTCMGPCAALVGEPAYRDRVAIASAFLEGRSLEPIALVMRRMVEASAAQDFERAAYWRDRFDRLEWLLAATSRARAAVDLLTFVYRDPGTFGDDRAYVVRHGTVRTSYPWPATPIEREAFRSVVRDEVARPAPPPWPLPLDRIDEILVVMSWFRRHPDALRHTSKYEEWM